jgi:hypothetical protein
VRRRALWALGVGAALIATAVINCARADVRFIDPDEGSASYLSPANDDAAAAKDDSAADITLFGGGGTEGANDARPDLILDPRTLPLVLVSGLPSPIADVAAETPDGEGVSPFAFFAEVIDLPHSTATRAVPFFLSTPSLTSQLSDFLWASSDFFGRPPGDTASRRSLPLSADTDYLSGRLTAGWTMRTPGTSTPSPSPLSGPPSSGAAEPFGQVGDEAGRSAGSSSDGAGSNN